MCGQSDFYRQRIASGIGNQNDNVIRTNVNFLHEGSADAFDSFISAAGWFFDLLGRDESAGSEAQLAGPRLRMSGSECLQHTAVFQRIRKQPGCFFHIFFLCGFQFLNKTLDDIVNLVLHLSSSLGILSKQFVVLFGLFTHRLLHSTGSVKHSSCFLINLFVVIVLFLYN